MPISLTERFLEQYAAEKVPVVNVPLFNRTTFDRVQAKHPNFVFDGAGVDVDIDIRKQGEWLMMEDGSQVWRLEIKAAGASQLTLLYDDFWLPKGAKFYLYTPNENQIRGAFTHKNNKESGKFSTEKTIGESVILEYYEPAFIEAPARIHINKVMQQLPTGRSRGQFGFDASSDCHININCSQGASFQKEKRGVVRIVMFLESDEGTFLGYCSGSLVNNTAQDKTPYVLTAYHCIVDGFSPLYDQWQFNFGYEAATCDNPDSEPSFQTVIGAQQIAGRQDPDFLLVKIASDIPPSFRPYFNGWNSAMNALPTQSAMIHHPCGDIKKITVDTNNTASIFSQTINWAEYTSSPSTHFRLDFDQGFSQVGASGSPLFGGDGLLYGQLHGGSINLAACDIINLFYGRLHTSWDSNSDTTRLKDWLDPTNSGVRTLAGYDPYSNMATFNGLLQTPDNEGIGGVQILFESTDTTLQLETDDNGQFNAVLPQNATYRLTFNKNIGPLNGVSTFDLVKIRQHILGIVPFDTKFKEIAGDANISGSITTFDMIEIQKVILGINKTFPAAPSWVFVSPDGNLFNILTLNDLQPTVNLSFFGVKIGDVNHSADPSK